MKLSRERIIHLSHLILEYLNQEDRIDFYAEPQEVRQDIFNLISGEMKADEVIDAAVRRKIESQRRAIAEGSDEWDVLYRKYYEEEVSRHRKVMP